MLTSQIVRTAAEQFAHGFAVRRAIVETMKPGYVREAHLCHHPILELDHVAAQVASVCVVIALRLCMQQGEGRAGPMPPDPAVHDDERLGFLDHHELAGQLVRGEAEDVVHDRLRQCSRPCDCGHESAAQLI